MVNSHHDRRRMHAFSEIIMDLVIADHGGFGLTKLQEMVDASQCHMMEESCMMYGPLDMHINAESLMPSNKAWQ